MKHLNYAPSDDVLTRLAAAQPALSPKMARLATYVSEQYVQVAFMSTRELATAAGVSLATVVRFPAILGYSDFNALRGGIQERVNFDLTGVDRLQTLSGTNRSPSALLRRIIDADVESLRVLAQGFSEPRFERFVEIIQESERVTILGFRYISALTVFFGYSLAKIKPNVQFFTQSDSSLYDQVRLMEADDTLVVLAVARYPADLVALVRYAHSLGLRIVTITDSPLSPVLPMSEVVLFAKTNMLDFVGSLGAPAALINCLVSELGMRLGDVALERLQAIEDAASAAGIYVRSGGRPTPLAGKLFTWEEDTSAE